MKMEHLQSSQLQPLSRKEKLLEHVLLSIVTDAICKGPPLPKRVGSRYPLLTRLSKGGPSAKHR